MGSRHVKLLLDTHILIWLAEGSDRLSDDSVQCIDEAARTTGLVVSSISFWETAMLAERGRVNLAKPIVDWRSQILRQASIVEQVLTGEIAIESVMLPGELHKDPADRMLAATARVHGYRLGTRDERLLDYGAKGYVHAVEL